MPPRTPGPPRGSRGRCWSIGDPGEWAGTPDLALERDREPTEEERREQEERRSARRTRRQAARDAGFATVGEWEEHLGREADAKEAARLGYTSVEEFRAAPDRFGRKINAALDEYLDEVGAKAAMAFTDAFLDTEFALGDGRRVTWGEATAEDHKTRIVMMTKMIEGCEEDVALHLQVLDVLMATGTRCLNELRGKQDD